MNNSRLTHTILTSAADLAPEAASWDRIVNERCHGNPFLSVAWHSTWLKHFGLQYGELCYVKILCDGEPAAYFPVLSGDRYFHHLKVRALSCAGNMYSPIVYTPIACEPIQPIFDYFAGCVLPGLKWDIFVARPWPTEYPGSAEFEAALARAGYATAMDPCEGNWIHDDPGCDGAAYFDRLKHNIKNDTRRMPKKLAAFGELKFRVVAEQPSQEDIEAYCTVYARSWKEAELDPSFHPAIMKAMGQCGRLRLGLMYLDDRAVSAQLWLFSQGRGYIVKTAYDEEFRSFSPGTLLTWHMIRHLMETEGMRYFDYLRGDDAYKKHWANIRRDRLEITAFSHSAVGRSLALLNRMLPFVRRNRALNFIKAKLSARLQPPI